MKKIFAFAVILALLVPAAAFAAAEFTLGGFVKLDAFWSSTQDGKNMYTPILRNNDPNFHHGRMKFTAQGSRFNLTIKGPNLWGAKTSGFIEMDFDAAEEGVAQNNGANAFIANNASSGYTPRLRHAMFRFNWPTTELLFGQYWSMFSEFYSENVQDGPMHGHGMPTARLAQVRVSQTFLDGFTLAGLIGQPNPIGSPTAALGLYQAAATGNTGINNGQSSESPQVQAKLQYAKDLWGKAAYYGAPMPFTARLIAGWQRNTFRPGNIGAIASFGNTGFSAITANSFTANHQYLNAYMLMANVFLPIIPTHSANLAGTASLSAQAYIGQGLAAFGEGLFTAGGGTSFLRFRQAGTPLTGASPLFYDQELYKQFGGYIQAQYYFTNHWFANVTGGMSKLYNVDTSRNAAAISGTNALGYAWAGGDQAKLWQEIDFTLWYRPIQAFKFGLQYAWQRTSWLQVTSTGAAGANMSNSGNSSRVEFVGFFYF